MFHVEAVLHCANMMHVYSLCVYAPMVKIERLKERRKGCIRAFLTLRKFALVNYSYLGNYRIKHGEHADYP
jgi:hypothetical protein